MFFFQSTNLLVYDEAQVKILYLVKVKCTPGENDDTEHYSDCSCRYCEMNDAEMTDTDTDICTEIENNNDSDATIVVISDSDN